MLIRWPVTNVKRVAEVHHVVEEGEDKSWPWEGEKPAQVENQTNQCVIGV